MIKIALAIIGVIGTALGVWWFGTPHRPEPSNAKLRAYFIAEFAKYESRPTYTEFVIDKSHVVITISPDVAAHFPQKPSYVHYVTRDLQGYYGRVWGIAYSRAVGDSPDLEWTVATIRTREGRTIDRQPHSPTLP